MSYLAAYFICFLLGFLIGFSPWYGNLSLGKRFVVSVMIVLAPIIVYCFISNIIVGLVGFPLAMGINMGINLGVNSFDARRDKRYRAWKQVHEKRDDLLSPASPPTGENARSLLRAVRWLDVTSLLRPSRSSKEVSEEASVLRKEPSWSETSVTPPAKVEDTPGFGGDN